jgi:pimeloyl-ACP methyl ester carboxylesterase
MRDELLRTFMVEFVGFGPEELEQLRASPVWAPRVAAAHTIPREIRAEENYEPDPDAFAALPAPVILLLGSESPEWARRGTEIVQSLLSNSRVVVLDGQGHVATSTAPELLAGEVVHFLRDA